MTDHRFSRIERMIGVDGLRRLAGSRVAVIGLGAVGSYAVEGLARAGVGYLRLVDFDRIRPSNINRQLYALESTVGEAKSTVARRRVLDINPACVVEAVDCFVHAETMDAALAGPIDLMVDAIDSLAPKVELLAAARIRGLPLISSMGAALRTDPGLVRVGPLSEVHHCPLAAKVRKRLRLRGIDTELLCVYSTEPVEWLRKEVIGTEEQARDELVVRGRARRVLGSLPTLTGIFGLTAANAAIKILLNEYFPTNKQ